MFTSELEKSLHQGTASRSKAIIAAENITKLQVVARNHAEGERFFWWENGIPTYNLPVVSIGDRKVRVYFQPPRANIGSRVGLALDEEPFISCHLGRARDLSLYDRSGHIPESQLLLDSLTGLLNQYRSTLETESGTNFIGAIVIN
jgi:hypothetical protein